MQNFQLNWHYTTCSDDHDHWQIKCVDIQGVSVQCFQWYIICKNNWNGDKEHVRHYLLYKFKKSSTAAKVWHFQVYGDNVTDHPLPDVTFSFHFISQAVGQSSLLFNPTCIGKIIPRVARTYAGFPLGGCSLINIRHPFLSNIKYYTSVKTSI